jgi:hypothetical protein
LKTKINNIKEINMSCYTKIKKALEISGVKVERSKNIITIKKDNEILTTYDLKFIEFSKDNTNCFIDYWKYKLKIKS